MNNSDLPQERRKFLNKDDAINVFIKKCDNNELVLDNIQPSLINTSMEQTDHSLRTFLELLITQQFLNRYYIFK